MNKINQNILITGGAGYIGSHFVKYLSDLSDCKYKIFVVDNLENGHIKHIPKSISFINSGAL
jgi:UDP-glucose 4-epimerase